MRHTAGLVALDGTVVDCSRRVLDLTGTTRGQVIGKSLHDAPWWVDDERVRTEVDRLLHMAVSGSIARAAVDLRSPSTPLGTTAVELVMTPVRSSADADIRWIVVEAFDLAERRAAESIIEARSRALAESEARFRALAESTSATSSACTTPTALPVPVALGAQAARLRARGARRHAIRSTTGPPRGPRARRAHVPHRGALRRQVGRVHVPRPPTRWRVLVVRNRAHADRRSRRPCRPAPVVVA